MPARWRTKSGCLTCRIRRKKCDEESKECRACRRNHLTCIWESDKAPSNALVRHHRPESLVKVAARNLTIFDSPTSEALLSYFASVVLPQLLIPGTPSAFHNEVLSLAVQYPCIRDSFLACASGFLTNCGQKVPVHAFKYYSSAVFATRKMIEDSKLAGTEDWLFLLTVALCIFERIQSGPSSKAIAHLLGATRVMALKVKRSAKSQRETITPLQQTCAAALLYHAATTAFLSPDLQWLPEYASWDQVEEYIEVSDLSVFAMPPRLCRVILEISRLARRTPLNHEDSLLALSLREQLGQWINRQSTVDPGQGANPASEGLEQIQRAAELYALTADILLHKIMNPQVSAEDSLVQARVKQVLTNLQSDVDGLFWNQHYAWPFAILGCTVQRETEMLYLLGRLEKLWERSHWGDIKRTTNLLEGLFQSRKKNAQFASMKDLRREDTPEPFDLLLKADGFSIFSAG
ncbi:fungal-specific transcription factor domain-containing protein [Aspergillus ambiguus]|uniref:Zn(II)2Cys6 transcription factor n=1 Tax=Aspergillus ambiguus TaxID=176160 RepID=UPI003CCCFF65